MQTIGVNIVPGDFPQTIRYSQGDIGREFKINVADFEIPNGATVQCVATKPSGLGFTVSGTVSGNTVSFVTTAIMTDEAGTFPAELRISKDSVLIGTANFRFKGELNPHPEGTTDGQIGTIIPELTLLVEEIRNSNAKVESMTASAVPLASDSDPTASYDAEDNNLEFGIPVPEVTESEFLKAFIVESASGSIASFTDGADDVPVKSLSVNIAPKQSGSGDPSPSNVRPISGWDEVEVVRTGKNLLDPSYRYNQSLASNYHIRYYWGGAGTEYYTKLLVKKGVTYTFSYDGAVAGGIFIKKGTSAQDQTNVFTEYNKNFITFTPTEDFYCAIDVYWANEPTGGVASLNPVLTVGSSAETYEPYQGTSYPIPLPSTVYGGTLNVVSGVLTVDRAIVDLGTLNWRKTTNATKTYFQTTAEVADMKKSTDGAKLQGLICSQYVENTWSRVLDSTGYDNSIAEGWGNKSFLVVYDSSKVNMTDTEFKSAMSGVKLAYLLATPTDFTTTPTEVTTLLGNNNIWSDAGTVEVEYRADSTLAYNELLSLIANM